MTVQLGNGPSHGALTLSPDGAFAYQPNAAFAGTDTFTYQASDGTNLSNIATVTITVTPNATLMPAGETWTAHESTRQWHTVASSTDGTKLVAAAYGGQLYTSTDAGVSWTARENNRGWVSVASSADGTKLVAAALNWSTGGEQLYTSTDAGVTWTARESNRGWMSVASSADGMRLIAAAYGGQLYTSIDGGAAWTAHESNQPWHAVASSADGIRLAAAAYGGQLYTSSDAGTTWTARENNRGWVSVASSADGTKLVAAALNWNTGGDQLYTSTDAGVTWTARESNRQWRAVASSADGTHLVAGAYGGQLYTSTDAGVTWTTRESNRGWMAVASSADGTSLAAATWGDRLYTTSMPQPLGLVYTPAANTYGTGLASVTFQVQDSGRTANGGVNLDPTANTITFNVTPVHQAVNTTTVVTSSANTSTYGDSVTFTATVTPAAGTARPAGSVEFFDGSTSLGSTTTAINGTGLESSFTLSISNLTAGSHDIRAVFTGTLDSFNDSTSEILAQTVSQKALIGSFTVANKVYDATTAASVSTRILTGILGSDVVRLSGGVADFDTANAGAGKTVTLMGAMLSGADASNYTLTSVDTTTATIAKATLTANIGNATKVFGQTINLDSLLGMTVSTGVNHETLTIDYSSAGEPAAALMGYYAISGSLSDGTGSLSNYNVTLTKGSLTVTTPNTVTIVQDGANLIIVGTDRCDAIKVNAEKPNTVTVEWESEKSGEGSGGSESSHEECEREAHYSVGVGGRVIVYGMAGADKISLEGNVNLEVHGGAGNDTITGGAGHDVIFGDAGNDILTGGTGNDVLVGDAGSDRLVGSAGHDLLISGELIGDHNGGTYDYAALRAIDDSWAANWSVDSDLESTSGDVLDESGSADQLTGGSGHDWFILGSTDKITDINSKTKDGDKITY